jgi:hypothetical protein
MSEPAYVVPASIISQHMHKLDYKYLHFKACISFKKKELYENDLLVLAPCTNGVIGAFGIAIVGVGFYLRRRSPALIIFVE